MTLKKPDGTIDFFELAARVSRRMHRHYDAHYVYQVYRGLFTSARVKAAINIEILKDKE